MQLVLVLAILAALVIADGCPSEPVSGAGFRLGLALAGMTLVALAAAGFSGWIAGRLRRDFQRRDVWLPLFRNLRRVHAVLWLAVAGGIFYWLDWARLVRFNWHLDHTILLDEVAILAPLLLPMVLSWAAFYEVDRAVRIGLAGADGPALKLSSRREYLMVHLRHYLGILLLPVLGLLAVQDTAELLAPGILDSAYAPAVYAPPIVVLFVWFPSLLRRVWKTRPLDPGPLRIRLEAAAGRAGFRAREILVWETEGRLLNAAVAGLVPQVRYVFLTDGLLARLDDDEIEAVFGHEIGHVRHHHLLLRVLAMIAPVSLWLLAGQALPDALGRAENWLSGVPGTQVPAGLLMLGAMALYALVAFGGYSRLLESQADLFGCRTLDGDGHRGAVETYCSALEKLAACGGIDRRTATWQHASVARRVELLGRIADDPEHGRRFQRRVDLLGGLLVAIVLSPVAYHLLVG
ncbi:MAG TPA: M48 family metallopeptidase [Thermoguttaceae bacterium]|nr:M48 family metallopeptidase [Thermoguttaceae bacterium]